MSFEPIDWNDEDEEPSAWEKRLAAAVAATLAVRDRRRNQRKILAENRNWGLARRHKNKLDRVANAASQTSTESTVAVTATDERGSTK